MQMIKLTQLTKMLGVGRTTIRRWEKEKTDFPKSFFIGPNIYSGKCWDLDEINAWLQSRKADSKEEAA